MSTIELYHNEAEAIGARDHYNHNLSMRAVVTQVPDDTVVDFGGGPQDRMFVPGIAPSVWMLVVEDEA